MPFDYKASTPKHFPNALRRQPWTKNCDYLAPTPDDGRVLDTVLDCPRAAPRATPFEVAHNTPSQGVGSRLFCLSGRDRPTQANTIPQRSKRLQRVVVRRFEELAGVVPFTRAKSLGNVRRAATAVAREPLGKQRCQPCCGVFSLALCSDSVVRFAPLPIVSTHNFVSTLDGFVGQPGRFTAEIMSPDI